MPSISLILPIDEQILMNTSHQPGHDVNPNNAIEIINVRLSLENTLLTLLRLQSLAYGFETFA